MLVHRWTLMLPVYMMMTFCIGDGHVSGNSIFVIENSTVILECPILEENSPIVWRGPPNLKVYGINGEVNINLNIISHKANILKNGKGKYNLKVVMFSKNDQGLFSCDSATNGKAILTVHKIKVLIAENPMFRTNKGLGVLFGEEGVPLEVYCFVNGDLPGPALYLSYQEDVLNSTNTSLLQYLFVPSKVNHLKCLTCVADYLDFDLQTSILLFVKGQPECVHENNKTQLSANKDITIAFNVYNPSGQLDLKCLNNMHNTFINCTAYNMFVQTISFIIQSCNRSFVVAGYVINITVNAKDVLDVNTFVINLENSYGDQNCTFNLQINETSTISVTVSSILIYTVLCGFCALLFCFAKCSLRHVRYRLGTRQGHNVSLK